MSQPDAHSTSSIRALGHIHLCGVLHVCWQTRSGVDGQYLICLLYRDFLLLASALKSDKAEQSYTVQACIGLGELRVEEVDNGKGKFRNRRDGMYILNMNKGCNVTLHLSPGSSFLNVIINSMRSQ